MHKVLLSVSVVLLILPWLALIAAGIYWLWQHAYLTEAVAVFCAVYALAWLTIRGLRKRQGLLVLPVVKPDDAWPPAATEIWSKLDKMAEQIDPKDYPLTDSFRILELAKQVTVEVARHYSTKSERAELDVPLRNILFIAEQVCRDIRQMLDEKVPFSHLLTVGNGLELWRWKDRMASGHLAYRVGKLLLSPIASIPRELGQFFAGKASAYPKGMIERWLLQTLIKKIGYYAIAMYSGQAIPPQIDFDEPVHKPAEKTRRPLRLLVAGQLKTGKSSLINALFGELRAPTDVLPLTCALTVYRLQHEGTGDVVIVDSPGYGDQERWFEENPEQAFGEFDLIVLVCSATQAGHEADAGFLSAMRSWFDERLERRQPPILLIASHIDQLRPLREWQPPYDVLQPQRAKEQSIREALEYISETLTIPLEDCLPVCLKERSVYNIEAVWTGIAEKLPESLRAQYLRCLVEAKDKEKWLMLRKQLANAGRIAVDRVKEIKKGKGER